jgi:putative ABC transport system permease protein
MMPLALKMLLHDRTKFVAMIMAIALAAFLMQNQSSILSAFLGMSGSQIRDVREANLWIMEPDTECFDQAKPLRDTAVSVVRGQKGVAWAVPFMKVDTNARTDDGKLRTVTLLGVDGANRIGEPHMRQGDAKAIYLQNNAVVDRGGWELMFPGTHFHQGRRIRVHDQWITLQGISEASPPFTGFPVIHVSNATAMKVNRDEQRSTTFIVARSAEGYTPEQVAESIHKATGWRAASREQFERMSYVFYRDQGVPMIFYITIAIGLVVGTAFSAQTFGMFIKDNARGLTTLKVLGVTHFQLALMLAAQAGLIMSLGIAFGTGLAAGITEMARSIPFLRGLYIPWQVVIVCAVVMAVITLAAAGLGFLRVVKLQPADVFRS